jgi:hypothetical protein
MFGKGSLQCKDTDFHITILCRPLIGPEESVLR